MTGNQLMKTSIAKTASNNGSDKSAQQMALASASKLIELSARSAQSAVLPAHRIPFTQAEEWQDLS